MSIRTQILKRTLKDMEKIHDSNEVNRMCYCLVFTNDEESLRDYESKKILSTPITLAFDKKDNNAKVLYDKGKKEYVSYCLAKNVNWKKSRLRAACSFSFFHGLLHYKYTKKDFQEILEETTQIEGIQVSSWRYINRTG